MLLSMILCCGRLLDEKNVSAELRSVISGRRSSRRFERDTHPSIIQGGVPARRFVPKMGRHHPRFARRRSESCYQPSWKVVDADSAVL